MIGAIIFVWIVVAILMYSGQDLLKARKETPP